MKRVACAAVTALLLSACGGSSESSQSNDRSDGTTVTDETVARTEPSTPQVERVDPGAWTAWERGSITTSEPGNDLDSRLTAMYVDLISVLDNDHRLFSWKAVSEHAPTDRRNHAPALLAMFGEGQSLSADLFDVVKAHADDAVMNGDANSVSFFEARSAGAALMGELNEAAFEAALSVASAVSEDQQCFLEATAATTDCNESETANDLLDLSDMIREQFLDLGIDDATDDVEPGERVCEAWDAAIAMVGVTPERENRIWTALEFDLIEARFIDLGECGWLQNREDEPAPDPAADNAAIDSYLRPIADAAVEGGFDRTDFELRGDTDEERAQYAELTNRVRTLIIGAAVDAAALVRLDPADPNLVRILTLVSGVDPNFDPQVSLSFDVGTDWRDVEDEVCAVWTDLLDEREPDVAEAIRFSVSELRLRDIVIPDNC